MKSKRLILFLIWLMMVVAYLDRVNISLAAPTIMAALKLNKAQFGGVLSAFQFGYAMMQIPGGYLADIIGARPLLLIALVVWSGFTALTGLARSLGSLIGVRVLFGLGEGVENGAQFKLIGDNFDSKERSSANALFLTALAIGPAIGSPLVTFLIGQVGWRGLFFWSAVPGIVVAGLLYLFLPRPTTSDQVVHTDVRDGAGRKPDWKGVAAQPTSWLAFAAYLFFNVGFWGFIGWMPSYLSETRHITLAKLGPTAAIPYLCGFVGLIVIGALGTGALLRHRAVLIAVGYVLAAGGLYIAFSAADLTMCIAGLSGAAFFLYGGFGPFWAIALDLAPDKMRGAFTGFVNVGGQIGGIVAPLVVGRIVDATKSFTGGFLFMMASLLLAAVSLTVLQYVGRRRTER